MSHDKAAQSPDAIQPSAAMGFLFGALSALGPFAIDFYLPAFPDVARDLSADPSQVKLSLSLFFLALAMGPMIYGTLSDRLGRKPLLFCAMGVFAIASLACNLAPSIHLLLISRFLQGLGAGGLTMMSRAMIRDLARGHEAARLLAFAYLIQGVSPILAPVAGGLCLLIMSWRGLFLIMFGVTMGVGLLAFFLLPETHRHELRAASRDASLMSIYATVLKNRRFLMFSLIAGSASAGTFSYLTGSPFLLDHQFHLSPTRFGAMMALAAGSYILAIQACPRLIKRFGLDRHLAGATWFGVTVAAAMVGAAWLGWVNLPVYMGFLMLLSVCFGWMVTPGAVGALDAVKMHGGTAAAVMATIQLLYAAAASATVSMFPDASALVVATVMLICVGVAAGAIRLAPKAAG